MSSIKKRLPAGITQVRAVVLGVKHKAHLEVDVRVPDADLHGQHLRRRVVLQEVGQVAQRGHQEARPVAVETQLQEAVALGQWGVSGGAGAALQAGSHLRAVEAAGGRRADVTAAGCGEEEEEEEG